MCILCPKLKSLKEFIVEIEIIHTPTHTVHPLHSPHFPFQTPQHPPQQQHHTEHPEHIYTPPYLIQTTTERTYEIVLQLRIEPSIPRDPYEICVLLCWEWESSQMFFMCFGESCTVSEKSCNLHVVFWPTTSDTHTHAMNSNTTLQDTQALQNKTKTHTHTHVPHTQHTQFVRALNMTIKQTFTVSVHGSWPILTEQVASSTVHRLLTQFWLRCP